MTISRILVSDCSGSTLPVFGVSLMSVFSIVGLAIALNFDSQAARNLQTTADSAALAGATAFITAEGGSADDHRQLAYDTADDFARANAEGELKSVAVSAVTTDEYGQHTEVNVLLELHPANIFNRFKGGGEASPVIRSAKAIATREFPLCLLALETTKVGIEIKGKGTLDAPSCSIWSNSTRYNSISIGSNAAVTTRSLCTAGQARGGRSMKVNPAPTENCQTIPDPLASWTPPSFGACDETGASFSGTGITISPGVYCGGLTITGDDVTLHPGLYVIKDGPLKIGATNLSGLGVTFLLTGDGTSINLAGKASLNLSAPDTGPLAGLAIAEDRTTGTSGTPVSKVTGNGAITIEGAVYLPSQRIQISGKGLGDKYSPYLQIVAKQIFISGLGTLGIDFRESEISEPIVIEPKRIARLVK